jgi:hypothetical protein
VLLHFTDARGIEWEVWEVGLRPAPADQPQSAAAENARRGLAPRWLCFESATERRRLAQYPERWHTLPPHDLDALCRAARAARGGVPEVARDQRTEPRTP